MATNLFKRFLDLVPKSPLRVGVVTAIDGTSVRIEEMGGGDVTVRGEAALGERVYFRNGVIEGTAPNLPFVTVEE